MNKWIFVAVFCVCSTAMAQEKIEDFLGRVVMIDLTNGLSGDNNRTYESRDSFQPHGINGEFVPFNLMYEEGFVRFCLKPGATVCKYSFDRIQESHRNLELYYGTTKVPQRSKDFYQNKWFEEVTANYKIVEGTIEVELERLVYRRLDSGEKGPLIGKGSYKGTVEMVRKYKSAKADIGMATDPQSRHSLQEETQTPIRELRKSVVEVLAGNSQGTGFFIDQSGFMVTNRHVVDQSRDCIDGLFCKMRLRQAKEDGSLQAYEVMAEVYALSYFFDFALIRIQLPEDLKIVPLELELNHFGKKLVTAGFPGDRRGELTIARGVATRVKFPMFQTNILSTGGASGSPILNLDNLKVVGILTSAISIFPGANPARGGITLLMEDELGIIGTIKSEKQARIRGYLDQLKDPALSQDDAVQAVHGYQNEKSMYLLNEFKKMMVHHPNSQVRLALLDAMEDLQVIKGNHRRPDLGTHRSL